ncbi:MAG: glycine cleavage system aminomethyltransferase GcvT [Spirochaetes bacterium]|jgi:aminomethyltransferase|nr:glycine cleavage system aminomethyltransferase GcvT [Spirochaetota bacterium]
MKKTALYQEHVRLGGNMVEFAGWQLPVMYSSIVEEHNATRGKAGLFDVSHMGEISVSGKRSAEYLSRLIPTRLDKLEKQKSMYSVFCNETGGIIDDLFIYMAGENDFFLVVNAATLEKDLNWMREHLIDGVDLSDRSSDLTKIDLQGPRSKDILGKIMSIDSLSNLRRFYFGTFKYRGKDVMISQSGYTGEFGFEIYIGNELAPNIWNDILDSGKEFGILPVGLGARDTLRLESCYSLYGHELNDNISPIEAGIGWIVSSSADYIAKNVLVKQKAGGAPRTNIVFKMKDRGVPRDGYRVLKNGEEIGYVTSGGFSPTLKIGIGMALVKSGTVKTGDEFDVLIRDKSVRATAVERPIYKYNDIK